MFILQGESLGTERLSHSSPRHSARTSWSLNTESGVVNRRFTRLPIFRSCKESLGRRKWLHVASPFLSSHYALWIPPFLPGFLPSFLPSLLSSVAFIIIYSAHSPKYWSGCWVPDPLLVAGERSGTRYMRPVHLALSG